MEHAPGLFGAAGILLSAGLGLAHSYFYTRIDVDPGEVGLTIADILLTSAAGVGFIALTAVAPTLLFALVNVTLLSPASSTTRGAPSKWP